MGDLPIYLALAAGACIYLLPSIIAFGKTHPNRWVILALNLFAGLTVLVWILVLIWALRAVHLPKNAKIGSHGNGGASGLNIFADDQLNVSIHVSSTSGKRLVQVRALHDPEDLTVANEPPREIHEAGAPKSEINLLEQVFSPQGRLRRTSFFARNFLVIVVFLAASLPFSGKGELQNLGSTGTIFLTLIYLMCVYIAYINAVKRCHDFNVSGWFAFLLFVPLVNIFIAAIITFKSGTAGRNLYGDPYGGF